MYQYFYQFERLPFSLTPDTFFFQHLAGHAAALQTVRMALDSGEGFLKVVGEVGTGKTMVCRMLLRELESPNVVAYLPDPSLSPQAMRQAIAKELQIQKIIDKPDEQIEINDLQWHLIERTKAGEKVIVLVDEAQALPDETLEALRLLSNLETEQQKLLQIVLFGQPELDRKLSRSHLRQLRQRISFSCFLNPLTFKQTQQYVAHRLSLAGDKHQARFNRAAVKLLFEASGGVPRLINLLAHKALMLGYGSGENLIQRKHIVEAAWDTEAAFPVREIAIWPLALTALLSGMLVFWGWP